MRKHRGKEAHLCHSGHVLMENRHGLCLSVMVDAADGHAERRCAKSMLDHVARRLHLRPSTLGLDAGFDDGRFLSGLERRRIIPHVPVRDLGFKAKDVAGRARLRARRRMRTKGYQISQRMRKRVEEIFGWFKTIAGLARTRFVGRWKILQEMLMSGAA